MADPASGELRPAIERMPVSRIRDVANEAMGMEGLIPLWFGEPDVATPDFICQAAADALSQGETFYSPNRGVPDLRHALARYTSELYQVPVADDRITITASGMSGIMLSHQLLIEPGTNVICATPAWPNVQGTVDVLGGEFRPAPLKFTGSGWHLELETVFNAVDDNTRAVFINSPGNPTGWVMPGDDQKALLAFCRERGLWLLADEVYARLVYDRSHAPSFLEHAGPEDRVIVINSFSKPWAMTGWRLGWLVTPARLGQRLEMVNEFNLAGAATFTQIAGITALRDGEDFIARQLERYRSARSAVYERLSANPRIRIGWPEGAFYAYFAVDGIDDGLAFCKRLVREHRVGLVPGSAFNAAEEGWLRLCFASQLDTLNTALDRLEDAIAS